MMPSVPYGYDMLELLHRCLKGGQHRGYSTNRCCKLIEVGLVAFWENRATATATATGMAIALFLGEADTQDCLE